MQAAVHTNTLRIVDARPRLNAHANVLLGKAGIQDVDRVAEDGGWVVRGRRAGRRRVRRVSCWLTY